MPSISAIVAMSQNRVIGINNQLPWHLPADLKHFKEITTGHPIIMGRKTFESIGKPLPNRTNIIVTRKKDYVAAGCIVVSSIEAAIRVASIIDSSEIFIIGGAEIFMVSLSIINRLYLTIIHDEIKGDVYFPELDSQQWREINATKHSSDDKNNYNYSFITLERVKVTSHI